MNTYSPNLGHLAADQLITVTPETQCCQIGHNPDPPPDRGTHQAIHSLALTTSRPTADFFFICSGRLSPPASPRYQSKHITADILPRFSPIHF